MINYCKCFNTSKLCDACTTKYIPKILCKDCKKYINSFENIIAHNINFYYVKPNFIYKTNNLESLFFKDTTKLIDICKECFLKRLPKLTCYLCDIEFNKYKDSCVTYDLTRIKNYYEFTPNIINYLKTQLNIDIEDIYLCHKCYDSVVIDIKKLENS
jgi:hypothetical protein